MSDTTSQKVADEILNKYLARTRRSRRFDLTAKEYLPAGNSRAATYYSPYPACMERGEGCYVYDCDGNSYIDLHNNYTSLIHGHVHPATVKAARAQLEKGTVLGSPAVAQTEHARLLQERMPSLELVRYCNSGTEATLMAMRAARASKGKDIIVKIDGGYHGCHDYAEVNLVSDLEAADISRRCIETRGVPSSVLDSVVVVPFNDLDSMEAVLTRHSNSVAAVIMEPMLGNAGMIPPKPGYLKGVRELANGSDVLLIFDEIITFRTSLGGLQMIEAVEPDLTTLGKIIGGGFPVGAFGGRREIMAVFDNTRPDSVHHSGTFNGNDITMAAGIATLKSYDQEAIDHVNGLGDRLRAGFTAAFRSAGIIGQCVGLGSLVDIHWSAGDIVTKRDAAAGFQSAGDLPRLLQLEMMNRGVFFPRRGQLCTSTPMTEEQIDKVIKEFEATLQTLKPYITQVTPHLDAL